MIHLKTATGETIHFNLSHKDAARLAPHMLPGCTWEVPARVIGPVTLGEAAKVVREKPAPEPKKITVVEDGKVVARGGA